jgi:protoporphyrinogen oxidase
MPKIVIIGAGLTGLSLAYCLEKNGFFDYEIFEAEALPGGLLKTTQEAGFTFDYTGHFLHISDTAFALFLEDVLGLENCNRIERASCIYSNDRYINYPFQQNIGELPGNVAHECLEGFVSRKKKIRNPKNFYEWVMKYFGKGFGKHFFFPFNSKQLNTPIKKIEPSWTSRFVPNTTLKSLVNSLQGTHEGATAGYNAVFHYPKAGGIYSLIKGIWQKLRKRINLSHKLMAISSTEKRLFFANGVTTDYDFLVTTAPLPQTLQLLNSSVLNFSQALANLTCNSVFNFNLGIAKPDISKKHWVYVPEKKFLIYRLGFWHNFTQNMVPAGHSAVYGEYSFLQRPNEKNHTSSSKKTLLFERAVGQVTDLLNLQGKDIVFRKDVILRYAYVVYNTWRAKNLSKVHSLLQGMDIHSIGRFGEWKYSSMQEAFLDGRETCSKLLRQLYDKSTTSFVSKSLIL